MLFSCCYAFLCPIWYPFRFDNAQYICTIISHLSVIKNSLTEYGSAACTCFTTKPAGSTAKLIISCLLIPLQNVGTNNNQFALIISVSAAGDAIINCECIEYPALFFGFKRKFGFCIDTLPELLHGFCMNPLLNEYIRLYLLTTCKQDT